MKQTLISLLLLLTTTFVVAEEVTYTITEYNADAGDFVIKSYGQQPAGSVCYFVNEYGATTGNRFNQIPRNREGYFVLQGWKGCTLRRITVNMCSNNKAGSFSLIVTDGETECYKQRTMDFDEVFGTWLSKDLNTYAEITYDMPGETVLQNDLCVTIKGGTAEGSVYIKSLTLEYDPANGIATESPMGWIYEKMEKKSTLAEGDVIMLYRAGDAAADIDGMATSKYLDAIGVTSTSNVYEYDIERFTLSKQDGHWMLTDQWGRKLGATKAQSLAWDDGVLTWDITLGYDGATIASTNTKYGTLRYNAPSGSYPRFWNYTSNTLTLPYIYRRVRQQEPIISSDVTLPYAERSVNIDTQDTLVIKASILPTSTTDNRLMWTSSNEAVATVKSGIVMLHTAGASTITATCKDSGCTATMLLTVSGSADGMTTLLSDNQIDNAAQYNLQGQRMRKGQKGIYITKNKKYYKQ